MKLAKRLFDFYLDSSLHIAFAVVALLHISRISFNATSNSNLNYFLFFGTVVGYNFLKYSIPALENRLFLKHNLPILSATIIAGTTTVYYFFQLQSPLQKAFFIMGFLILAYPFLRRYGMWKMVLVGYAIAMITVYIPFAESQIAGYDLYITMLQRFLITISLLIPLEIEDSQNDKLTTHTLPQKKGVRFTQLFGILLLFPFLTIEFLKANSSYIVLPISIITAVAIQFSAIKRNKYFTSFWVESIPILWWLILMLFNLNV